MTFSLKKLLLATTVIAAAVWFARSAYQGFTQIEQGENASSVDWLPDKASHVSYFRSYMNTAYEFDIDEDGFRKWSRWDTAEIRDPVTITRYSYFAKPRPELASDATAAEYQAYLTTMTERSATISDGLYYGYLQSNGGGVWVAYDRETGRAYYQSSPR